MKCTARQDSDLFQLRKLRLLLLLGMSLALTFYWTNPVKAQENAQVTVGHFAPFAGTVEGTAVEVRANGDTILSDFQIGDISEPFSLPADDYLLEVLVGEAVAISTTVTVAADTSYQVSAIGDGTNQPLELYPQVVVTEPDDTFALVRVSHFSPFSDDLAATAVDICLTNGTVVFDGLQYKESDVYNQLAAGTYELVVAAAGTDCEPILQLPAVTLAVGEIVDIFAFGIPGGAEPDAIPFDVTASPGLTLATPAQLSVAHFAPFAATVPDTTVDIRLDGTTVISDLAFGEIRGPLDVPVSFPAREYLVEVVAGETTAISATVMLDAGTSYLVPAIGGANSQPLELLPLVNETVPNESSALLRVGHLAPFAEEVADTAVDICAADGTPFLSDVEYRTVTGYIPVPAGTYALSIAAAGTDCESVFDLPSIVLADGDIADVFAIGLLGVDPEEGIPFTVATSTGLNLTADVQVSVAHFAAFAESAEATAVNILVNGEVATENLVFGETRGPSALPATFPAGEYLIEVVVGETTAISDTFVLQGGMSYVLAAIGDGVNQPLELVALTDETMPDPENAKLRIGHYAPFAMELSETAVDICHNDGLAVLEGVEYSAVADLVLPPGDYNLVVSVAGTDCASLFDIPAFNLAAGSITNVFAIGYPFGDQADEFPFALRSTTGIEFSMPAQLTIGHFAPFAEMPADTAVSIFINGSEAISNAVFSNVVTRTVSPGRVRVDVVVSESESAAAQAEPAISQVFTLSQGLDYSIFAVGGTNDWPLELIARVNDRTPDEENARVRIGHLAPFAAGAEATAVAICTMDNNVVGGLSNVPYGVITEEYLVLPPGAYALKISAADDCEATILELPVLDLAAGDVIELYATGLNTAAYPLSPVIIGAVDTIPIPTDSLLYIPVVSNPETPAAPDPDPDPEPLPSITEIAAGDPRFSTLVTALTEANLADTLAGEGEFTVFAPINEAFDDLPDGLLDTLLADPAGDLTQILLYHVIAGVVPSSALAEGLTATTLQTGEVVFSLTDGATINGIEIIETDIQASNGIIHVIRGVLIPAGE